MKKKQDHIIVAIHVTNRVKQAGTVQSVLTRYGGNIKTRIGLHEPTPSGVSPNGVILLELVGSQKLAFALIATLKKITGVEANSIVFEH
ncbi:MAG: hypothetical protein NT118_12735 [Lentisphaerae bacterium]|nr:hypothetical protein [Lentisphaerota bacterium]